MRAIVKKIVAYVSRSWEPGSSDIHPRLRLLPPFVVELFSYLLAIAILYQAIAYLLSLLQ